MKHGVLRIALWSVLGVLLVVTGYLVMNTTFMPYDDEGFVLLSLRNYLSGLRLYDDVFSQYGPWPYVYHQIITTAAGHAELTHAFGRTITLLHWVVMSLLTGGLAWRLTRSHAAAGVTALLVFSLTWQTIAEPSHPGSHIGVLVAAAALLISLLPEAKRPARVYAGLGLITGLLLLTKINVGLLLAAGVGGFALQHTAWPRPWHRLAWLGAVGLLALPWVLLFRQLHFAWALVFAGQFTLAAAGLLWLTPSPAAASSRLPARAWPAAVVAALGALAVICGWVLLRGTTPGALVQTVLLSPLRMPANFIVRTPWYAESLVLAAAGALAVARAGWEIRRGRPLSPITRWLVAALRVVALGWLALHVNEWPSYYGIFHFTANCLPLLAVFLVPLGPSATDPDRLALWGAAWIALPQVLHAFPVAGSQLAWATFLVVPLLVAGWWDLGRALPALVPSAGHRLAQAGGWLLGLAAAFTLGLLMHTGWQRYTTSRPLDLPGAEDIRIDGPARQALRVLTLNATIQADLLLTRQGMYSFNLWSGVPTPTAQNATHWFWLLSEQAQREIIARLEATPRSALIFSHSLDAFITQRRIPATGPLLDFVTARYQPLFRYGDYSFLMPAGSQAAVFGRYELQRSDSRDPAVPPLLFRTNVLVEGAPLRIRLEPIKHGEPAGPDLLTDQTQVIFEPIDRAGRTIGAAIPVPVRHSLRGLYRLTILAPNLPPNLPWQDYALVIRGPDGQLLSESVYF
jgi:hypothetical protein